MFLVFVFMIYCNKDIFSVSSQNLIKRVAGGEEIMRNKLTLTFLTSFA